MVEFLFERLEDIVGKDNANYWYQHLSPAVAMESSIHFLLLLGLIR